jgi:NodT family efflux transporter outer membrane factor (OMF) lipoprotein
MYAEDDLQLAVASSVSSGFFTVVALVERYKVAEENLNLLLQTLELVTIQYEAGLVTGFDISSQRSAVASGRAQLVGDVESQRRAEYGLAVLLGEQPKMMTAPEIQLFDIDPPEIILGSPVNLLEQRPDLRSAEADLRGADADIVIARAALFPRIDLSMTFNEGDLLNISNIIGSMAGSLSAPIFNAGRISAGVDRAESRHRELVQNYYQATLEALREVEGAGVALRIATEREVFLIESRDQALIALRLAQARYAAGADDLISVLAAQRSALNANDSVVTARLDRLTSAVELYRALGGGG